MFDIFDKGVEEAKREVYSSQEELEVRLGDLQREMKAAGIPTVVVFEGWSASGKGTMIGRLIRSLDPRGFKVYSMTKPTDEEFARPQRLQGLFHDQAHRRGKTLSAYAPLLAQSSF